MLKRFVEVVAGMIIGLAALASYGDEEHPSKLLVGYVTSNGILQAALIIAMLLAGFRLVGGNSKTDYGPFFFKLFVKVFGLPKKDEKHLY